MEMQSKRICSVKPNHLASVLQVAIDVFWGSVSGTRPDGRFTVLSEQMSDSRIAEGIAELQRVGSVTSSNTSEERTAFSLQDTPYVRAILAASEVMESICPGDSEEDKAIKSELGFRVSACLAFLIEPGFQGLAERKKKLSYALPPRVLVGLSESQLDPVSGNYNPADLIERVLSARVLPEWSRLSVELPPEMFN